MANPQELKYTEEHEWLKIDGDSAVVGITAYAAEKLGDVVYVELPRVGAAVVAGTVVGEIESTKSVGELYAPVTGTVLEANGAEVPECFGLLVQYPGASGRIFNPAGVIALAKESGAIAVVAADLLALTLIASPGELGADVAVGTSQRFGVPMGFGGPHAGYLAVRAGLERSMPGRLVGVSVDANGESAYRLTLQAREQHIRRDKATSNICTAQVLLAVMAGMYAVYHGPDGLRDIAQDVHSKATALDALLRAGGSELAHENFFDTLEVRVPGRASVIFETAKAAGFLLNLVDDDTLRISLDETTTHGEVEGVARFFGEADIYLDAPDALPTALVRTSSYLTHEVFNTYRSETAMMRYLKRLADYDYALDRGMIPLGSCTMKLNAATEMEAVSWPEYAGLHPFAPADDVAGYLELISQLEKWLVDVTGYDTVSLQPNAGSQGELAGLFAIRGFHLSNGHTDRTICLIPSSAHGTNAASAVLAGMSVVVVACDEAGNVDLGDLRAKIAAAGEKLAALMITYPSTHGVYEHEVLEITNSVHAAGGQVYVDGANFNALTGFARYGDFDDVAKRLVDFGFHAPTMSFPVPGTLMIEPTESEDLTEIERFIDAMITIKAVANIGHPCVVSITRSATATWCARARHRRPSRVDY